MKRKREGEHVGQDSYTVYTLHATCNHHITPYHMDSITGRVLVPILFSFSPHTLLVLFPFSSRSLTLIDG